MFIIPLTGKISWRNPPAVTLGIILINCFVYLILQSGDMRRLYQAEDYYIHSGLAEIEVPLYIEYLNTIGKAAPPLAEAQSQDDKALVLYHNKIEADIRFLQKLRNDEIITPDRSEYVEWKALRETYENELSEVVFLQYGFRPAYRSALTFFTYMFLHGSVAHLIGNMIFLWIIGCVLELGCGRLLYSGIYIFGGLLAVVLYWLIHMESTIPLVGASGAIASLMGAFTVLFGRKKVNIFYSLGFYFNYLKIPAIILLPVWIANELLQLFFDQVSQVAYVAHIGGLISGALLGLIGWKYLGVLREDIFKEEPKDEISPLMEKALERISELDLEEGRRLLKRILEKNPRNLSALTHLFNIEKHEPVNQSFHEVTQKLLFLLCQDDGAQELAYQTYSEYIKFARPPRLTPQLYLRISIICLATGRLEKAKNILATLLKKQADLPGIPSALLKLANAYREKGIQDNWEKCLQAIFTKYPNSNEAQIAKKALKG